MKTHYFGQRLVNTSANALAILLALSTASSAIDFFDANGGSSGDWNDPLNWRSDALPDGTGDRVHIGWQGENLTANITGALTNPSVGELRVGSYSDGGTGPGSAVGVVNMSGGTLNAANWSFVGVDGVDGGSTDGTMDLSGDAVFNSGSVLALGVGGNSQMNLGTMNLSGNSVLNTNLGDGGFAVGWDNGNTGVVNQSAGSTLNANWVTVGANSANTTGTYNIEGGTLNSNGLTVGENDGATGTLNFSSTATIAIGGDDGILVGRNDGSTGEFKITGSTGTINTTKLSVGVNTDRNNTTANGTLRFISDSGGVTPIVTTGDVLLNDGAATGSSTLLVDLETDPVVGDVLLVEVGGTLTGSFTGLAEGAAVPGSGGRMISYTFGDGNDIGLTLIPEPSSLIMMLGGLLLVGRRRR